MRVKIDTFSISTKYKKDPFGIKHYKKHKTTNKKTEIKHKKPVKKKKTIAKKTPIKPISIKHIKYYGIIKNSNTSKTVGILYINNKEVLVSNGSEIKDGKVISIYENKINIMYKNKMFEIERKQLIMRMCKLFLGRYIPLDTKNFRYMQLKNFPYMVHFVIDSNSNTVDVFLIIGNKENPDKW